jgi:predicted helicase
MIDTIAIMLEQHDFHIVDHTKFSPNSTGLFQAPYYPLQNGRAVCVQNPSAHDRKLGIYKPRLTITKRATRNGFTMNMKIEFSIPKLFHGNNFQEVTETNFREIIGILNESLKDMGVLLNNPFKTVPSALVSVIHYSKNFILKDNITCSMVLQELSKADVSHILDLNATNFRNGGHALRFHSNSYEIVWYDKLKDLQKAAISEKRSIETDAYCQLDLFNQPQQNIKPPEIFRMETRLGNPPYYGESKNNGDWIMELLDAYKKEPNKSIKLQERNAKWINNDYAKFIRMGEYYIERNNEGVLAYITSNSYLESPTFRGMRWHLLNTFDDIYILDLHGNSKKGEKTPEGNVDDNVFDITEGVSIIIAIKKKEKSNELASLYHADLWGRRASKYSSLENENLNSIKWEKLEPSKPLFLFVKRNETGIEDYNKFFKIKDLVVSNVLGFQTHRDQFAITFEKQTIREKLIDLLNNEISDDTLRQKYNLKDNRDWQLAKARQEI